MPDEIVPEVLNLPMKEREQMVPEIRTLVMKEE